MLGKLLKHEFRATGRVFILFYAAMIGAAIVTRLLSLTRSSGLLPPAPYILGIVAVSILIAGVMIVALILTIQRFNKNLIGDEGYLMFTLPVSRDGLILSKLIASVVWTLVSVIVALIALMIIIPDMARGMLNGLSYFFTKFLPLYGWKMDVSLIFAFLAGLCGIAWSVLSIYAACSLSMLSNSRRGAAAFGFWFAISVVVQILGTIAISILTRLKFWEWFDGWFQRIDYGTAELLISGGSLFLAAAGCAILYFITRQMLKHKLNLE